MCVTLNSLFEREMNVYYVKQLLKPRINNKTNCHTLTIELSNKISRFIYCKSYLGAWGKIEIVIKKAC